MTMALRDSQTSKRHCFFSHYLVLGNGIICSHSIEYSVADYGRCHFRETSESMNRYDLMLSRIVSLKISRRLYCPRNASPIF
jgi:hypothetical protein